MTDTGFGYLQNAKGADSVAHSGTLRPVFLGPTVKDKLSAWEVFASKRVRRNG